MSSPRLLVIDDDDSVRRVTCQMLRHGDYDVAEANSGRAGLECFNNSNFDLVLLDVSMPDMGGVEVSKVIREAMPDQKIIFMTGHAEQEDFGLDNPHTWMLGKPFRLAQLLETVKSVL